MKVSVVMCTYNGASFLSDQLESIANQSRLPDELIIGDDGSEDATAEIVRRFTQHAPFPVFWRVNPVQLGVGPNFGATIARCTGEIILLADQDDVWVQDKVEILLNEMAKHPKVDLFFTDALIVDESLNPLGYTLWEAIKFSLKAQNHVNSGLGLDVLLKQDVVTGATVAFRTRYRDQYLPIPAVWLHDAWLAHILILYGAIKAVPKKLVLYRQHSLQQIGGQHRGTAKKMMEAPNIPFAQYHHRVARLQALTAHLSHQGRQLQDMKALMKIADKQDHFKARANLPQERLLRLKTIWQELRQGRYRRFSAGVSSILKDVLLPAQYFQNDKKGDTLV